MATKYTYNEKRKEWYTLVYDGTLTATGEKHRKRISSKKSSKDLERKVQAFKESLENTAVSGITLGEYADKWIDLYKSNTEINTRLMYENALHYFVPIYDVKLSDLTRSHFQQIINLNQDHPRTCVIIAQTFRQVIKSAMLDGLISDKASRMITTDITLPKQVKRDKKPLTAQETDALLNAPLDPLKRAFVTVLYYCGLRKGEALALTPADFDFKNNTVTVNKVIVINKNTPVLKPYPKSDNGVRVVPLCKAASDVLSDYVANCTATLFPSANSPYMTSSAYKSMWGNICMECNKYLGYNPNAKKNKTPKPLTELTAHRLRHNFCTLLCYQVPRISTKTIARLLGDTEKMVLDVYSHILEEKEDITGALESAFGSDQNNL